MKTITQKEIARKLGISQMTVSRVLGNKPVVKENLRDAVLKLAGRSGYVKNRIASSFALGKTRLIGCLIPRITSSYFPALTDVLDERARARDYHLILAYTGESYEKTADNLRMLMELRVDALLVTPPAESLNTDIYTRLQKNKIPFVFIDRYLPGLKCSYVVTDTRKGSKMAMNHLIGLGHTKIAHLRGPEHASTSREIFEGYKAVLKENRIAYNPQYVKGNSFEYENGYLAAQMLLEEKELPTAIFAVTDEVAIGAMQAMEEKGLHVPDDIALVGCSNTREASLVRPRLTTIQEDTEELGKKAAEVLFELIDKKKRTIQEIRIEPKLIIRESSGISSLRHSKQ